MLAVLAGRQWLLLSSFGGKRTMAAMRRKTSKVGLEVWLEGRTVSRLDKTRLV